jgi:hypothetical protein
LWFVAYVASDTASTMSMASSYERSTSPEHFGPVDSYDLLPIGMFVS